MKYRTEKEGSMRRIYALKDFGDVIKGEKGGLISSEANLSHSGNAWVSGEARVCGKAKVYGNAWVYDNAWVSGDVRVYGKAQVYDSADTNYRTLDKVINMIKKQIY